MRALPLSLLVIALASSAAAACYVGPVDRGESGPTTERSPSQPGGGANGDGAGGGAATGLPCDVDTLLAESCRACHSSGGSAPMPLVTYEDLIAPAPSAPEKTTAEVSLERMISETRPMPPSGPGASTAQIEAMQAWIDGGLQRGTCGEGEGDGGSTGGARPLPGAGGPTVCTSGRTWSSDSEGPTMQPGRACITCHMREEDEPIVQVGGTVYPTLHEPDGCYGAGESGAEVVITDATGREVRLPVGPTGNFSLRARGTMLVMPIRAKVVQNGLERAMATPQSSGNCNSCHTERGENGAPGRIVLP